MPRMTSTHQQARSTSTRSPLLNVACTLLCAAGASSAAAASQAASPLQAASFKACAPAERGQERGGQMVIPADLLRWTQESAQRNGLPWPMLMSLIWQESTYCQKVVSSSQAIGLGQLKASTARAVGVDPHDPRQNIEGAARYLRSMALRYGNWPQALGAYNAGPTAIDRCGCWNPYAETQQHVLAIINRHNSVTLGLQKRAAHRKEQNMNSQQAHGGTAHSNTTHPDTARQGGA